MLTGDTYFFLYSLPVVMTCTLVASVIVSFTFMPLIAYYLIKPPKTCGAADVRAAYSRFSGILLPGR